MCEVCCVCASLPVPVPLCVCMCGVSGVYVLLRYGHVYSIDAVSDVSFIYSVVIYVIYIYIY